MKTDALQHPVFGPLVWDPELERWDGACLFRGNPISLVVNSNAYLAIPGSGIRDIDPSCEGMFSVAQSRLEDAITEAIRWVQTDLPHWFDDVKELSDDSLRRQLTIDVLEVFPGGQADVWFHGPESIYNSGHAIQATITEAGKIEDFKLQG